MKISVTHDKKLTFNFRKITLLFICVYIITIYLGHVNGIIAQVGSLCLMGMAAFAAITVIVEKKMQINPYLIWYALFLFLCAVSAFYTPADNSFSSIYGLIVILLIGLAFCVGVRNEKDVESILILIVISSTLLMIYLLASGYIAEFEASDEPGKRFGNELTGNANAFATIFMIAACVSIYFIIAKKNFFLKIACSVALYFQMYGLILAGSRKNILIPFILIYVILLLQKSKKGKHFFVLKTICAVAAVFLLYYLVINVPFLYDNIGYRFESVIDYETGAAASADASAMEREALRVKAMILWVDAPIFGHGINGFSAIGGFGTYSHNNFLELMCNHGILGTFVYYVFYALLLGSLFKKNIIQTNMGKFFFSFIICQLVFEYGQVTYSMVATHIMLMLISALVYNVDKNKTDVPLKGEVEC